MRVAFTVNGEEVAADDVWPGESLLYVLRERLGLPGSKNACEQGECGSCTVYLDEVTVCACMVAAGQAQGRRVRTVEGLAAPEDADAPPESRLSAVQEAFVEAGAVQCGFCTPGLLVQADDLIARTAAAGRAVPGDAEIREALAGNLCRCTGYEAIVAAVRLAAERERAAAHRGGAR
ncbi:(2Fe-2S)-binding protein [Streptomonospora litoralis]|uniref:Carbon monoxide dehydrogenase small chain n=1 Tax=Streptomonospora litoralis TaxID=2498135 RepID=A0A4P6Q2Y6_9ACTN|nr:(2Fe-2S)-binding protein [Streptomonospora litoralis]QBI54530.1 Carbon monoxide dehydrogenase small chain [Streptomonospora litoralis]